jgi:ABC-type phosphate transport system substrate-binding protein
LLKKKRIILFNAVSLLLVLGLFLGGCSQFDDGGEIQMPDSEDNTKEQPGDAVKETARVQIRGSDSEVNLIQTLAEEFMKDNFHVQIAVTGLSLLKAIGTPPLIVDPSTAFGI